MKPVDTHCHLDFERFDGDRGKVIERSREELGFIVNAGRDPESNRASLELARKHDPVVANLGLHPTHTDSFNELDTVRKQVREHDPAAVGEVGLDHHHITGGDIRDRQEEVFREMLELASELEKPAVVHSREAEERTVELVEEFPGTAMLHCFNGTVELAERAVEDGNYIGITTQVLYSDRVKELARELPPESLVLETDSPFLYRGERNEPVNVRESAEKIADIRASEPRRVVETTTRNARDLFGQR